MAEPTSTSTSASTESLERNAIGLTEVLFQSITHMAPAVATALSIGARDDASRAASRRWPSCSR